MKKTIRIHYTNFEYHFGFNPETFPFTEILRTRYNVIIDKHNPDFLFYSCFFSHNYENQFYDYDCTKMFFSGENASPDFNTTDYAIGSDFISFEDRYLRLPFYEFWPAQAYIAKKPLDRKFCNFLYSNHHSANPFRNKLFHALSSYKQVDSGGALFNNIGRNIENKFLWQQEYKFSIACENSCKPGYTTEKTLEALQANTVPIYWGNPRITQDFPKNYFINAMDFASIKELVEYVKFIDQNDEEYLKILNAPRKISNPLLENSEEPHKRPILEHEELKKFLFHIFDQEPADAKRVPNFGRAQIITQEQVKISSSYYSKKKRMKKILKYPIKSLIGYLRNKVSNNK